MNINNRILELCNERNISINKLAELSDITQSTLNSIMNNSDPNPQFKTVERICIGLGITLADFFAEEKPELEPELRRLLDTAKKLTPEQREYLQKLLETMSKD
jgi:HTH-type transcriptional regulator, repressor for puuD